nr:reverse transcriptase domain-containing protein [Tanacetum cinerariifolium]
MRKLKGKWIMKKEVRMILKDGTVSGFPGYTSSKEEEEEEEEVDEEEEEKKDEEEEEEEERKKYDKIMGLEILIISSNIVTQVTNNVNNANANGGNGGNGNGENNGCSYKAFLACNPRDYDGKGGAVQVRGRKAAIGMSWVDFKALLVEKFCPSNEIEKLESEFWNHTMVGANHAGYTDRFYELAKLVPHLVTPKSKRIRRYINRLAPSIRGMLRATQPTTIQSAILKAGILTDKAVRCGTLIRSSEKRKEVKKTSKQEGVGDEEVVIREESMVERFEEDEDEKKSEKDGIFN